MDFWFYLRLRTFYLRVSRFSFPNRQNFHLRLSWFYLRLHRRF